MRSPNSLRDRIVAASLAVGVGGAALGLSGCGSNREGAVSECSRAWVTQNIGTPNEVDNPANAFRAFNYRESELEGVVTQEAQGVPDQQDRLRVDKIPADLKAAATSTFPVLSGYRNLVELDGWNITDIDDAFCHDPDSGDYNSDYYKTPELVAIEGAMDAAGIQPPESSKAPTPAN